MAATDILSSTVTQAASGAAIASDRVRPCAVPPFLATRYDRLDDPRLSSRLEAIGAEALSPFQTTAFLRDLTGAIAGPVGARVFFVGVEDSTGRLVAVLPFALRRCGLLKVIEGLDLDVSDYWVPVAEAGRVFTHEEAESMMRAARKVLPAADALTLKKVPYALDGAPHPLAAWSRLKPMGAQAVRLALHDPDGVPICLSTLSGVKDARKKLRKLERSHSVGFHVAEDADGLEVALDHLIGQRRERFRAIGRPDLFDRPEIDHFYRSHARSGLGDGTVRVFTLTADGEVLAGLLALRKGAVMTIVVTSMSSDPRWTPASPGLIMMTKAIEWALAAGHRTVDLSVGALAYKTRFAAIATELAEAQFALRPTGYPLLAVAALRRRLRHGALTNPRLAQLRERFRR